ncbi:MAG: hypothetical protein ACLU62_01075 [Hydrogeniiclostridium sp.]
MKKTTITAVAVGCAAVILLAAIWIASAVRPSETVVSSSSAPSMSINSTANDVSSQENLANSSSSKLDSTPEETGYVLKAYMGHIGIFRAGEETPIEEMDVKLESLPEADQQLLIEGIPAKDKETLRSIMEDYES